MKNITKSIVLPLIIIILGGLLLVATFWLLYLGIYLSVETVFYPSKPQAVPADLIRTISSLLLGIAYLSILRTKWPDIVKSTLLVAPMTTILITIVLDFYMMPFAAVPLFLVVVGISVFLIYKFKKNWFYYFAVFYSIIIALLYSWPRP